MSDKNKTSKDKSYNNKSYTGLGVGLKIRKEGN